MRSTLVLRQPQSHLYVIQPPAALPSSEGSFPRHNTEQQASEAGTAAIHRGMYPCHQEGQAVTTKSISCSSMQSLKRRMR